MQKEASRLREWVRSRSVLLKWLQSRGGMAPPGSDGPRRAAYDYVRNRQVMLEDLLVRLVLSPSCMVEGCKACCFFNVNDSMGVPVEKINASRVRVLSESAGVGQALRGVGLDALNDRVREKLVELGEYVLSEGGRDFVYYTRLNEGRRLPPDVFSNMPVINEEKTMWNRADSAACAMLDGRGRCILYGARLPPKTCRHFICMTGNAVNVLSYFGLADAGRMNSMPLSVLNDAASRIDGVFGGRIPALQEEYDRRLKALVEIYQSGETTPAILLNELQLLDAELKAERGRNFKDVMSGVGGLA